MICTGKKIVHALGCYRLVCPTAWVPSHDHTLSLELDKEVLHTNLSKILLVSIEFLTIYCLSITLQSSNFDLSTCYMIL